MKTLRLLILLLILPALTHAQQILDGIQAKIETAFDQSFATQQNKMAPIIQQLGDAEQHTEGANTWIPYWQAFGHYYEGLYFMNTQQKADGIAALEKGIDLLESQEELNSEEHVMVGTLMGLLMGLAPGKVMTLSAKSGKHLQKAVKKDAQNMRAYMALGKSDYYTPKMFGGGKKVEEYLLKALSMEDQHLDDSQAPTWGRSEAYMHLVQFYQREDRTDEAKLYVKKALKEYPDDYSLNKLDKEL